MLNMRPQLMKLVILTLLNMFIFAGLILLSLGVSLGEGTGCGKRPLSARVVNGDNAAPHSWPWQVSLRKNGGHFCGGSLIRPDWVVTAAHCLYKSTDPSGYTVVVGAHRRKGTTDVQQEMNVKKLIIHRDFTTRNLRNDIALLQLDRPAQLSDKVTTVCLPDKAPELNANCYITGWGRIYGGGQPADELQQAKLPVTPHEDCKKKYRRGYDRQVHLCAGEGREGASGGCQGDSGGPFVCESENRWYLHGAVSFGERWCSTAYYTIFTRITTYVPWILNRIGEGGGGGEITLPPLPPTQQPTTAACEDKLGNCDKFFCFMASIKKDCPKTCKTC